MPTPAQLREHHQLPDRPDMHVIINWHAPDRTWRWTGYACVRCGAGLRTEHVARKHRCSYNRQFRRDNTLAEHPAELVVTVSGRPWRSLEFDDKSG